MNKATVVDSNSQFSDEIDVVLFDRKYTPLIFEHQNEIVVPAEAVYAVFESKQEINAEFVKYAQATGEGYDGTTSSPHERVCADD